MNRRSRTVLGVLAGGGMVAGIWLLIGLWKTEPPHLETGDHRPAKTLAPAATGLQDGAGDEIDADEDLRSGIETEAGLVIPVELGPGLADEWIEFERLPGSLLFPQEPMRMESAIWRAYQMVSTNPSADAARLGSEMLSSTSAWVRATGAIWMLEKNGHLEPEILDRLLADEEVFVPLTVLGWMLDSGSRTEAGQLEAKWKDAPDGAWQAALHALDEDRLGSMAGRAALWMAERSDWSEAEKGTLMVDVALDPEVAYDVRWKAALLLQGHMDLDRYRQITSHLLDAESLPPPFLPEGDEPENNEPGIDAFRIAMFMLNERMAGPASFAEHPVLTDDDAHLFFAQESSLMLENVALWVEAIVDQRSADAEAGFASTISRHLADLPEEELPANQRMALRRIQSRMEALVQIERP